MICKRILVITGNIFALAIFFAGTTDEKCNHFREILLVEAIIRDSMFDNHRDSDNNVTTSA